MNLMLKTQPEIHQISCKKTAFQIQYKRKILAGGIDIMFAAFSFPKPESCAKCPLLMASNKFSGICALNRDIRTSLESEVRAPHCPLIFLDDMRNTFPISKVKEAYEVLIKNADELESIIEDDRVDATKKENAESELRGILLAMKVIAEKLRLQDVKEWFEP